ncbi:ABC transporter permease subunit [Paraburkholderia sediminicola]|uniref:ABC transporter permease subunit n=1 Tax=Paraburkholderia sediminicola TaxID=458836 RepID=UPI0038B81DEF
MMSNTDTPEGHEHVLIDAAPLHSRPKQAAKRRRSTRFSMRTFLCVAPVTLYLAIFLIVPVAQLFGASFTSHGELSLSNYIRIASAPVYGQVLAITFKIAGFTTLLAVLGGYPLAYLVTIVSPKARNSLLFWITLPFWTSFLVRSFAWIVLLGRHGLLNQLFMSLGLADAPFKLLYTFGAVLVGMVHALMPLAILTMMSVMSNIDRKLLPAASTLGSSPVRAFLTIYLPLSVPGIAAAAILVFVTSLGFFVTPALMGSRHDIMLTQVVIDQVLQTLNWGFAGALSMVLLVAVLIVFAIYHRVIGLDTLSGGTPHASGSRGSRTRTLAYATLHLIADASDALGRLIARVTPKRTRRRKQGQGASRVLWLYGAAALIYLLGPTFLMIPESFTALSSIDWPPHGFSMRWYEALSMSPKWLSATIQSLAIATVSASASMLLGVPAAFFLSRSNSRWRTSLYAYTLLPLIVPHIIYAVGLFYFLSKVGLVGTIAGMAIGHTAITIPYVVVTTSAILKHYDQRLDAAAQSLGATRWQTLTRVTFPILAAGMVSAFLFAFVTSFDELTIALFLTSGLNSTLPKLFWDEVSLSISPVIAAVSTCLFVLSVVVIGTVNRIKRKAA